MYEAHNGSDCIPIYYQDAGMYIDPMTRQNFTYATPTSCDNIPQNVKGLDLHNDEHYVLTPKPVLPAAPTLFQPKQVQSANCRNIFHCTRSWILLQC